jgi:hypothetical protein
VGNETRVELEESNKFGNGPCNNREGPMMQQLVFRLSRVIAVGTNIDPNKLKTFREDVRFLETQRKLLQLSMRS